MNRRSLCLSLALPLLAASVFAQPRPTVMFGGGVLVGVDATASAARVRQGQHEQAYTIAKDAEILHGKDRLALDQLSTLTGHYVTLRYTEDGATRLADRVKVTERKEATASTSTKTAPTATATH